MEAVKIDQMMLLGRCDRLELKEFHGYDTRREPPITLT